MNINKNNNTHHARSFSDFKTWQRKRELTGLSHDGKTPRAQRIIFKKNTKKGWKRRKMENFSQIHFRVAHEKTKRKEKSTKIYYATRTHKGFSIFMYIVQQIQQNVLHV